MRLTHRKASAFGERALHHKENKALKRKIKREGKFYVYIVECADRTYYTGYTNDLEKRLKRHNDGLASKYTRARLPVKLAWSKEYEQFQSAFKTEMTIKDLTRLQKESLVKGKRLDKVLAGAGVRSGRQACGANLAAQHLPHGSSDTGCQVRPQCAQGKSSTLSREQANIYPAAARTRQPKVFIKTYGCQMNSRDSEEIMGMLFDKGYSLSDSPEEADVALFNTCSVRKHAEERAISNIGALKALKKKRPEMIIGVVGCMAKAQKEELLKKLPHVDFISAPANIYEVPGIIEKIQNNHIGTVPCGESPYRPPHPGPLPGGERGEREEAILAIERESRPEIRNIAYHKKGISALVTIMEGCNNFCSYCIVPYVRGREVGRPAESIIDEIKALADKGYKEVTLLGQNVNSYRQSSPHPYPLPKGERGEFGKANFIKLLEQINGIEGIERIRFLTSHPKDAGEDLFKAMRDLPKVCEHLHLPLQSGSDRLLKSMNRGYTASEYARKTELLRKYVPECAITTDIIVGYPGETEEDFKATKKLMEGIGFNSAFIFKYSPRPPAKASALEDNIPKQVKEGRNQELLGLRDKISAEKDREFIGKYTEVLIESECRKEKHKVTGRNRQNLKVALVGKNDLIGKLKMVKINSVFGHTLVGGLAALAVLFGPASFNEANARTAEEYFVLGDYEAAAREAAKTLSSESKEKDKLYYISGTSLNKLGRYELARENFKSLIENHPRSGYAPLAQLGLADSYYLSADYQNAAGAYEKYITVYPKSGAAATAYFRLGKCAQKEGRWRSARNYYQKVKAEYPLSFEARTASEALSDEILYFTVQVGSFGKKSNALKLCDELVKKGYDASILKARGEVPEVYRVRVGRLDTRAEAEELAKRLQAEDLPVKILP